MQGTGQNIIFGENVAATSAGFPWAGGLMSFEVEATFGGGTVKLQKQLRQGTWVDVANASLTAAGYAVVEASPGQYRANVATATAVYVYGFSQPRA